MVSHFFQFQFPFIICVSKNKLETIKEAMPKRLRNTKEEEFAEACSQVVVSSHSSVLALFNSLSAIPLSSLSSSPLLIILNHLQITSSRLYFLFLRRRYLSLYTSTRSNKSRRFDSSKSFQTKPSCNFLLETKNVIVNKISLFYFSHPPHQ